MDRTDELLDILTRIEPLLARLEDRQARLEAEIAGLKQEIVGLKAGQGRLEVAQAVLAARLDEHRSVIAALIPMEVATSAGHAAE